MVREEEMVMVAAILRTKVPMKEGGMVWEIDMV